jgi:23S rRNA pseudouridine1911/1915/1917 synthase
MRVFPYPFIVDENDDFAAVYKPPGMHCAPLKKQDNATLTDWFGNLCPEIFTVNGKKAGEGGLVHRLDFHTRGLVLFAKNQKAFNLIQKEQDEGRFIKEYKAVSLKKPVSRSGFPVMQTSGCAPSVIESNFRSFGPGRKEVRPVLDVDHSYQKIASDRGSYYRTEICGLKNTSHDGMSLYEFDLKISRGFRHQIRCHLAWVGFPILNDVLYGQPDDVSESGYLALCSYGFIFTGTDSIFRNCHLEYRELELSPDSV